MKKSSKKIAKTFKLDQKQIDEINEIIDNCGGDSKNINSAEAVRSAIDYYHKAIFEGKNDVKQNNGGVELDKAISDINQLKKQVEFIYDFSISLFKSFFLKDPKKRDEFDRFMNSIQ